MNLFQKIFKVAQSESHSLVEKLEDPIKMTEQGIRDLKNDLTAAMQSLAEVKSIAIRMKKDAEDQVSLSSEYERKAMLLLQKAQGGQLDVAEADRLATEALARKEEADAKAAETGKNYRDQSNMADQLQAKVNKLKTTISQYENELVTLRARARTADSMKKINKQLSQVDSSGTVAMLEKMKQKVNEQESLAQAYGDIAVESRSVDQEIDDVLAGSSSSKATESLAAMKAKLGMNN